MATRSPNPFAHLSGSSLLQMGLTPIQDPQWIAPFDAITYRLFLRHKQLELASRPNALLVSAQATLAIAELLQALRTNLQDHHSVAIKECGIDLDKAVPDQPLAQLQTMTYWIPDDICVLQLAQNDYRLTAASVLSPSLWRPDEKFMQPLAEIHRPIPDFNDQLMPSVTRFFNHLKVGWPVVRFNASIQPGNTLNRQPETEPEINTGTPLYYRSERQTLLRLQDTQAVVFFIRTQLIELSELADHGVSVKQVVRYLKSLPDQQKAYKNIAKLSVALEKYLSL